MSYRVGTKATSDHFPVEAIINFSLQLSSIKPILKRSFKKVDMKDLKYRVASIEIPIMDNYAPDKMLESWSASLTSILDDVAPLKQYPMRKNRIPWITDRIRELQAKRDFLAKKVLQKALANEED